MRKTYRLVNGELVEVTRQKLSGVLLMPDLPDYQSPIDGAVVHGRSGRREDLKRNECRPWEGMDQERREEQRRFAYAEQANDHAVEVAARKAFAQMRPDARKRLEYG